MYNVDEKILVPAVALVWFGIGVLLGMRVRRSPQGARNRSNAPVRIHSNGPVEIYVGNLASETGEDDLRKAFERFGKVDSARVISNRANGGTRVFAFVVMAEPGQAAAAIQALNGKDLDGRRLVVNEARSPRRRGRH
jgi:cold-inducible RNA-binding protein